MAILQPLLLTMALVILAYLAYRLYHVPVDAGDRPASPEPLADRRQGQRRSGRDRRGPDRVSQGRRASGERRYDVERIRRLNRLSL